MRLITADMPWYIMIISSINATINLHNWLTNIDTTNNMTIIDKLIIGIVDRSNKSFIIFPTTFLILLDNADNWYYYQTPD